MFSPKHGWIRLATISSLHFSVCYPQHPFRLPEVDRQPSMAAYCPCVWGTARVMQWPESSPPPFVKSARHSGRTGQPEKHYDVHGLSSKSCRAGPSRSSSASSSPASATIAGSEDTPSSASPRLGPSQGAAGADLRRRLRAGVHYARAELEGECACEFRALLAPGGGGAGVRADGVDRGALGRGAAGPVGGGRLSAAQAGNQAFFLREVSPRALRPRAMRSLAGRFNSRIEGRPRGCRIGRRPRREEAEQAQKGHPIRTATFNTRSMTRVPATRRAGDRSWRRSHRMRSASPARSGSTLLTAIPVRNGPAPHRAAASTTSARAHRAPVIPHRPNVAATAGQPPGPAGLHSSCPGLRDKSGPWSPETGSSPA